MSNEQTNERAVVIELGGETYELLLTTRATKEIGRRYGGLENLGEKLMKSENFAVPFIPGSAGI